VSFENLLLAYNKAKRGKRSRPEVAKFSLNLEPELLRLQRELHSGDYQPGRYRLFTIYERKPRVIAAAPFRDRVVHHAVMNIIEPPLDRTFLHDSYACRAGKGTHAAVDRYQVWSRRYTYALKMDIAQYFPSIDHALLKEKLRRCIKDRSIIDLLDRLIDSAPVLARELDYFAGDDLFTPVERRVGIPIGNLTSQFFANFFLNELDHHIKEVLGSVAYLRYVDDRVALDDDKWRLAELRCAVREHLERERLRLHPRKAHVSRTRDGLNILGYVIYPRQRRLCNDNGHRFARRLRHMAIRFAQRRLDWHEIDPVVHSWMGHAGHADTEGLRRTIFSRIIFQRGTDREATGV
jgi:RNA-directed DNA polymerase